MQKKSQKTSPQKLAQKLSQKLTKVYLLRVIQKLSGSSLEEQLPTNLDSKKLRLPRKGTASL